MKSVLAFLYRREQRETRIFMPRWNIASMNDCLTITLAAEHITMAAANMKAVLRLTLLSGEKYRISPPTNRGWVILHIKHKNIPMKAHFPNRPYKFWYTVSVQREVKYEGYKTNLINRPVKQDNMMILYSQEAYFKSIRMLATLTGLSWSSSVPLSKCQGSILIRPTASLQILCNSSFISLRYWKCH